jgi:hypothetical protein
MAKTEQKKEEEEEEEKETSTKFVNLGSLLITNRCTCNQFTVTCRIVQQSGLEFPTSSKELKPIQIQFYVLHA